nr:thiamine phosphate synthase [Solirubrobacterales bacterium]
AARIAAARLYFVCDACPHGSDPRELLDAALRGGVDVVQLRDKGEHDDSELIELAAPFRDAARAAGALFVLNDRPDLVEACGADGVHVGQDDLGVARARELAPPGTLVGLSTHSERQLRDARAAHGDARPDQLSVGPVWETPTKHGRTATGLELIEHAALDAGPVPWFAIGGIDAGRVGRVADAGAARAVVVRAIRDSDDPQAAAAELRSALERVPLGDRHSCL